MKILKKIIGILIVFISFSLAGPGLADGASKFVGNITTNGQVRSDFGTYWNQITAENECKWQSIEGRARGQRDFTGCKRAYNWAKQNGGHFKFHALLWGSQYPSWLENLSVDETKKAITDWFDAVKNEFPDLEMIDVVNEAIRTGNNQYHSNYPKTKIIQAMGGDNNGDYAFITNAFKMARERWPDAVLIYNDYNTVQWNKNEGINLIQTIKKNGAPIDGYGLQAHDMQIQGGGNNGTGASGDCLAISTLKSILSEIWEKTKVPIFITEYDIATENDNIQKQCYSEQISAFMENEHVGGITIWGYIYGSTWTTNGNSGIIKNGQDRPAMTWLKEYLSKNKGVNTTGLGGGKPIEPIPQKPFKDTLVIPGKIEIEDFDISGVGEGNISYYEGDVTNHGDVEYREDAKDVDFYKKATGVVIGYQDKGEWYEYTVNVKETGTYTMFAAVTSADTNGRFKLLIDGKDITEELKVPKGLDTNYTDYSKVSAKVNLTKGTHILRYEVINNWFDIDYITFVEGEDAKDPEPIIKDTIPSVIEPIDTITTFIPMEKLYPSLMTFKVFDFNGKYMGLISGYSIEEVKNMIKAKKIGKFIIIDKNDLKIVF